MKIVYEIFADSKYISIYWRKYTQVLFQKYGDEQWEKYTNDKKERIDELFKMTVIKEYKNIDEVLIDFPELILL